jgi:hypothetical protein
MIELYLKRFMNIILGISIAMMIVAKLFKINNSYFIKTALILFTLSLFLMGIWTILGTIYRWKSFKKAYKRIDFERLFGGFGSIIYVIIGISTCITSIFLFYHIILKIN